MEQLSTHPAVGDRELSAEPLGGLVVGQRLGVAAARQLEVPAGVVEHESGRGVRFGPKRGMRPGKPSATARAQT